LPGLRAAMQGGLFGSRRQAGLACVGDFRGPEMGLLPPYPRFKPQTVHWREAFRPWRGQAKKKTLPGKRI
jgi:hypothetical protein